MGVRPPPELRVHQYERFARFNDCNDLPNRLPPPEMGVSTRLPLGGIGKPNGDESETAALALRYLLVLNHSDLTRQRPR